MARKSRRNKEQIEIRERIPEIQSERRIQVGGYVRLSSDQYESDSIETQMLMIRQFVDERPEMELREFYCDEGYSGTNFARPEFARMMDDVKAGKIECIIVKDFSRFGRNYIEAGYYLETILPHMGIRFISINDRFDSNRAEDRDGITLPIKNLINSMYAADVSKKIAKSVELHHKIGDAKYRTTTYGYFLNRETNSLEVDPVASQYVRLIFWWYIQGYSTHEIANKLNLMNVPIPSVYKEQYSTRKSAAKNNLWSNTVVCNILQNQTYIGNTVNGKQQTRLTEHQDHQKMPECEWHVHENTHQAIVSRNDFETVNAILERQRTKLRESREIARGRNANFKNLFSKKLVCAECGKTMSYIRKNTGLNLGGVQTAYYTCSQERNAPCRQVVYEDRMKMLVVEQLKRMFLYICGQRSVIQSLREGTNERSKLLSYEKKLVNLKRKLQDTDNLLLNLYKDLAEDVIEEEEYHLLNSRYRKEKDQLQKQIELNNEMVYKMRRWIDSFENLGEKCSEYLSGVFSSQAVIEEMVQKIIVFSNGDIELVLNCADVIERFNSLLEEENEEDSNILTPVFGG